MTDSLAREIARLREEIHAWRLEQQRDLHGVVLRVTRLELTDNHYHTQYTEYSKRAHARFTKLENRLSELEGDKAQIAWLGWSAAGAILSVAAVLVWALVKLVAPGLATLFS